MNFVFISPNFPHMYYHFGEALKNLGANVLGLGDDYYDNLSNQQKASLTEYYRADDLNQYDQMRRGVEYFVQHYGAIDQIDSFNEYWLEKEAHLRTDFNIPGIHLSQMVQFQQKTCMKEIFQKAGVKFARGELITTGPQLRTFVDQVGFPIIIKPDRGVGAWQTSKIDDPDGLETFIKQKPVGDHVFIVEEFINGQLESFDGLTDKNGKAVFFTSHIFYKGIMEIVNQDLDMLYYSRREIPADLEEAGKKILDVLDIKGRFFHIEFFRTLENKLCVLEINLRPPGGLTVDMFNYANDIDIYQQWAKISLNRPFDAELKFPYHTCYIGRKNQNQYSLNHQEVIDWMGHYLVHHERIDPVFRGAIGDYGYILRGEQLDKVLHLANLILQKV